MKPVITAELLEELNTTQKKNIRDKKGLARALHSLHYLQEPYLCLPFVMGFPIN